LPGGAARPSLEKAPCSSYPLDEIATGFHRTGELFALRAAGVLPDIVTIGKALTGGTLPLACAVASEEIFEAFLGDRTELALQHGPTYMGNALACAAAQASLDLFERDDYAAHAGAIAGKLEQGLASLRDHQDVLAVRVRGAIGAVEMRPGTAPPASVFAKRGAFVRPLRLRTCDVVYLMPSLLIDDASLDTLLAALTASLARS
jgi:adenosylmethionine-8-amino-7-oxononanoate aminotransferase